MTARQGSPAAGPKKPRPLIVPKSIVDATYESFAEYCAKRVESVVYWYGLEAENADTVVSLAVPSAQRGGSHYKVDSESVAKMARKMIRESLVYLAQFHTHPGLGTAHSHTDDREAMSDRGGFLSIVAPCHGSAEYAFPDSVSVHEARGGGGWRLLGDSEKSGRVVVVDDAVDARGRDGAERHLLGSEGARLHLLGRRRSRVGIKIGGGFARSREGQKMLWAVCNLLCRLKGVVAGIEVCAPGGTSVAEQGMLGQGPWSGSLLGSLKGALDARARECTVSTAKDELGVGADIVVLLGPDTHAKDRPPVEIHAACNGWLADCWYGADAPPGLRAGGGGNPFGAMGAACIAAGEVFKRAGGLRRDKEWHWQSTRFSMYDLRLHDARGAAPANPALPDQVDIGSLAVFGCGAVGHAFCQCLDMVPGIGADLLLVDRSLDAGQGDEVIDGTNLARYVMCTNKDVGKAKARALAAAMQGRSGIVVSYTDEGVRGQGGIGERFLENAVSCVDNNPARHEIQDLRPRRTHGGSVFEMQSQVSVYDAAGGTQCLKCNNPVDGSRGYDAPALAVQGGVWPGTDGAAAGAAGPPSPHSMSGDARLGGGCGTLRRGLRHKTPHVSSADFSVNFVTAFSGAVSAGEIVKRACSSLAPALDCSPNTDMFYSFWTGRPHLTMTRPRVECCGRLVPAQASPRRVRAAA